MRAASCHPNSCAAKRRYLRRLAPKARPPQPPKINTTHALPPSANSTNPYGRRQRNAVRRTARAAASAPRRPAIVRKCSHCVLRRLLPENISSIHTRQLISRQKRFLERGAACGPNDSASRIITMFYAVRRRGTSVKIYLRRLRGSRFARAAEDSAALRRRLTRIVINTLFHRAVRRGLVSQTGSCR